MITTEVLAVSLTAAGLFAMNGAWLYRRAQRREEAEEPITSCDCDASWHPMPCGTRLELGATGFYIILVAKDGGRTYEGFDPENCRLVHGNDLMAMKAFLAKKAAEREEFAPLKDAP